MTTATTAAGQLGHAEVTEAVLLACRAPSIHNTQPWRWQLRGGVLELRADRSRQLAVADRDGHSLMVSCGAAVSLTELGLRTHGWTVSIERLPDPAEPDLLARFTGVTRTAAMPADLKRVAAARARRSERRPFAAGTVSSDQIEMLRAATVAPDAYVHFAVRPAEILGLAVTVSHADRVERGDPEYLAETARWVHPDGLMEGETDGVPAASVPRLPLGSPRHTDVPVRDFELGVRGAQLIAPGIDEKPLLAVVFTTGDRPVDELLAGEAMMRLMLEAELLGLASCPLSQAVDMAAFRSRLKAMMDWPSYPQMMLRLGPRPIAPPAPLTRRRPIHQILAVT
jgi:nitroreductase